MSNKYSGYGYRGSKPQPCGERMKMRKQLLCDFLDKDQEHRKELESFEEQLLLQQQWTHLLDEEESI